nr:MoaD/ThiS family protein [Methanobrevibacter millerae]
MKFKEINEKRELKSNNYSIKNLLNDLELSSQTIVAKQNGELSIEDNIIREGDEIQLLQIIYGG